MKGGDQLRRHMETPQDSHVPHPPGDEIYRKGNISFWEIDGKKARVSKLSNLPPPLFRFNLRAGMCVFVFQSPQFPPPVTLSIFHVYVYGIMTQ